MRLNKLQFSIKIKATPDQVWKVLWDDGTYRDWVSVFSEGSYAVTNNWEEGSQVLFLVPDKSGIYSIIEKHIPNKIIRFKHIGSVVKGKKQAIDHSSNSWSGATEQYSLTEEADATLLEIKIDVLDEHVAFMSDAFPKALEKIRRNCM